ncbi:hypothetical protein JHK87_001325 [Glycine soja]|nr:hypothetical protein JHK87_001325 [Glycine soja]
MQDFSQQPPAQELIARDMHGNEWKFRHIFRGQSKRHLLTTGWSVFVAAKRLVVGDSMLFIWQGGNILTYESVLESRENFVEPTIVEISLDAPVVKEELFGPVLYVMKFQTLEEAIALNNSVPQGLSSSIFTQNLELYSSGSASSDTGMLTKLVIPETQVDMCPCVLQECLHP